MYEPDMVFNLQNQRNTWQFCNNMILYIFSHEYNNFFVGGPLEIDQTVLYVPQFLENSHCI